MLDIEVGRRLLAAAETPPPWYQGREGFRYEDTREVYSKREPEEHNSHDVVTFDFATDAELAVWAIDNLRALLTVVEKVRQIHRPANGRGSSCVGCLEGGGDDGAVSWPCPTYEATQ